MRVPLLLAGVLAFVACGVHGVIGHVETYQPLMNLALTREVKMTLAVHWHAITAFLFISAIAFVWAGLTKGNGYKPIGVFFGFFYAALSGLTGWFSYYWFGDPLALPQWLLLAPIGLFAFFSAL